MTFYTNDKVPQWKGNLFVGGLQRGRIPGTGQIQRSEAVTIQLAVGEKLVLPAKP